jgi:hypothetical protein
LPKANPPHLSGDTDRHGNRRWYVRLPTKHKYRIKEEYGSEAFWQTYRDVLSGKIGAAEPPPPREVILPGSFRALCVAYFSSPESRL